MTEEHNPFQSPESTPPPQPVPQSRYGQPGPRSISDHARAILAMVLLGFAAVFDLVCIGLHCIHYDLIGRLQQGGHIDHATATAFNQRLNRYERIDGALICIAFLLFLVWVFRAYRSLSARDKATELPAPTPASEPRALFLVNLVAPFTNIAEIWRFAGSTQHGIKRKPNHPFAIAWWLLFWAGCLLHVAVGRMQFANRPPIASIN